MPDSPLSLCLINRNYPPQRGATGYFASHFIKAVKSQTSHDVHVVTLGKSKSNKEITYVSPVYDGKKKILRLLSAYRESELLIKAAERRSPDVFIVMTDPALLNYWASKRLKDKTWVYWSMDLFPEGFKANELIAAQSFAYKRYQSVLKGGNPSYLLGLGDEQLDYIRSQYYPHTEGAWLPIGLREGIEQIGTFISGPSEKITVGYVGNVGEAHDPGLIADCLLAFEQRGFNVMLRCYGTGAEDLLHRVDGSAIKTFNHVSEEQLRAIDIHLVSLRKEWTHICVPSKALSALQGGNTVLFLGSKHSDTWQMSKTAGWLVDDPLKLTHVIDTIDRVSLDKKKKAAQSAVLDLRANYNTGLSSFFTFLEKIKTRKT